MWQIWHLFVSFKVYNLCFHAAYMSAESFLSRWPGVLCSETIVRKWTAPSQYDLIYFLTFSSQEAPACAQYQQTFKCAKLTHSLWLYFRYIIYPTAVGTDMDHQAVSILVSILTALTAVSVCGLHSFPVCRCVMWYLMTYWSNNDVAVKDSSLKMQIIWVKFNSCI